MLDKLDKLVLSFSFFFFFNFTFKFTLFYVFVFRLVYQKSCLVLVLNLFQKNVTVFCYCEFTVKIATKAFEKEEGGVRKKQLKFSTWGVVSWVGCKK